MNEQLKDESKVVDIRPNLEREHLTQEGRLEQLIHEILRACEAKGMRGIMVLEREGEALVYPSATAFEACLTMLGAMEFACDVLKGQASLVDDDDDDFE